MKTYKRFYEGNGHGWVLPSGLYLQEGYQLLGGDLRIPVRVEFQAGDDEFPSCWWITFRDRNDLERLWERDGLSPEGKPIEVRRRKND